MPYIGELSSLLTACLWSGSSMIFAAAAERVGSVQMNIARLSFATVLLFATILIAGIGVHLSTPQALNLAVSGIVGLVFGDTFLFAAYTEIGARLAMLLMSLAPAVTAILAFILLGEVLPFLGVLGIIVTMAGIAIVVLENPETSTSRHKMTRKGLVYGLLAALGQAAGLLFAKKAFSIGEINGFVAAFVRIIIALSIILPAALLARRITNPVRVFLNDRKALRLAVFASVMGSYLGITFSLIALKYTAVGVAATIQATPPIIMLPLSRIFHKEVHSWKTITGAFIAVAGVAILFLR